MLDARRAKLGKFIRVIPRTTGSVFTAFSEASLLEAWFFPPSVTVVRSDLSFQPAGRYLYGMQAQQGSPTWGRLDFVSIQSPSSIVFVQSVTNERGGIVPPLAGSAWLLKLESRIDLAEHEDGALLTQSVFLVDAGPEERGFAQFTWDRLAAEYQAALDRLAHLLTKTRH